MLSPCSRRNFCPRQLALVHLLPELQQTGILLHRSPTHRFGITRKQDAGFLEQFADCGAEKIEPGTDQHVTAYDLASIRLPVHWSERVSITPRQRRQFRTGKSITVAERITGTTL